MDLTSHGNTGFCLSILAGQSRIGVAVAAFFFMALMVPLAVAQTGNTALIVSGPSLDPITSGGNYYYLPRDGTFTLESLPNNQLHELRVDFRSPTLVQEQWSLSFYPPIGEMLQVASYDNCIEAPVGTAGGLFIDAFGIGCGHLTGSFIVHELVRNADGDIVSFHISFQQSCEGTYPPLSGEIFYNSSELLPPAPAPTPTPKPSVTPVVTVSVSPKQVTEGSDAIFTFHLKPAQPLPFTIGITETIKGGERNILFPNSYLSVRFGAGVTNLPIPVHIANDGIEERKTNYTVRIIRVPIYKIGSQSKAIVTIVDPPH